MFQYHHSERNHPLDDFSIVAHDLNEQLYKRGDFQSRLLNPEYHQPANTAYIKAEMEMLIDRIPAGARVLDCGCGFGRHLAELNSRSKLSSGLGIDMDMNAIAQARRENRSPNVEFYRMDARSPKLLLDTSGQAGEDTKRDIESPLQTKVVLPFTHAICMFNTIANIPSPQSVYLSMRRLLAAAGTVIFSVYSCESVADRMKQYEAMGCGPARRQGKYRITTDEFWSEHFDEARIEEVFPGLTFERCSEYGFFISGRPWTQTFGRSTGAWESTDRVS